MLYKMLWEDGFFWPKMWADCKKEASTCWECVQYNIRRRGYHPMSTIKARRAWDHLVMDFIGPFLTSERGYTFILIIVDVLTRFVILKPVQDKRAITVAYVLVNVFTNFGILKILQSDNEKSFVGKVMQALRGIAGFEMRKIMNYFPCQNRVIERYVQEAKNVLKKWIKGCVDKWECYVPAAQMGLNDQILSRHKSQPFSLLFGQRMNGFKDYRKVELETEEGKWKLMWVTQKFGEKKCGK